MDDGFDTSLPGTPEEAWEAALMSLSAWQPQSKSIVVVAPHPDDETLGAGGLLYTCAQNGLDITVVLVTNGEAANTDEPGLAARRLGELQAALRHLTPGGCRVMKAGLPDGKVAGHLEALTQLLETVVGRDSTLVGPFEADGHTDHDAAGRACMRAATKLGVPLVRYPIWAWQQQSASAFLGTAASGQKCPLPNELNERKSRLARVGRKRRRRLSADKVEPQAAFSRKLGRFPLQSDARAAKGRAIACYVSQIESGPHGAVVPPHVLQYFRRPYEVFLL